MSKTDDGKPVTEKFFREELKKELAVLGVQLSVAITETITKTLREEFRAELDRRFAESEARVIGHVEDLMAEQSLEITSAVANMIHPMQSVSHNHKRRIAHLEQKIA